MTRPSNDSVNTWHVHPDDTWGWGIDCSVCYVTPRVVKGYHGPAFNIHHLKRQNAEGTTTASEVREVLDGIKPEDRDKIARRK